jgi:hypothetical protein
MNKNNILFQFQEPIKIKTAIEKTNTISNNYNDKVRLYMSTKAAQFIKYHNSAVNFNTNKYEIFTLPFMPNYYYLVFFTSVNTNHPYVLFININEKALTFLIPIGKDSKQAELDSYFDAINYFTNPELSALYILVEKTIAIRKNGIVNSQYSLLNCENITPCINKFSEIAKMKISETEKTTMYKKYNEYYLTHAVELLTKYFTLLDKDKNYDDAQEFLKGGTFRTDKYFGKQRLNNFFKNNKTILGHLEIFISLYKLLHEVRMKLLKY